MRSLVIAPHPDDEILGVGGTLLRRKEEGVEIGWLIMTEMTNEHGWSQEVINQRNLEIEKVKEFFGFTYFRQLRFPTSSLDQVPIKSLVEKVSESIEEFKPSEIFIPHFSDVHSDHRITSSVAASCSKWFRNSSIKRVLSYETLSETDFGLESNFVFHPNFFVNIENYLDRKLEAMSIYESEFGVLPFPRSAEALVALATLRGSTSGFKSAEAFQLLREFS